MFLRLFTGASPVEDEQELSEFIRSLSQAVDMAKANKEWRRQYMTLYMRDIEQREEGRKEERVKLNDLNAALVRDQRLDDLQRSFIDPEFQNQLLAEYGLVG